MKRTILHLAIVTLIAQTPILLAQESATPDRLELTPTTRRAPAVSLAPAASPTPAVEPEVTLIPEHITPPAKAAPEPAAVEKKSKTEESAEDLQMRIHFREARTKALRDEKVQAEYARAMQAKTDQGRREAMKSYYKLLYARIVKLDPSVTKLSTLRETAALHRLEQTRIDPTEPLDVQDRENAFARGE